MNHTFDDIDQLSIHTIRTLSMDAVEHANSGHPGAPMGLAPIAYLLFTRFMKHNPYNPDWADRDRFVLSCGHASMLLYSILHLTGYDLSLDDLRNFRQWDSPTPGHPEFGHTPGVEMTTGPLGQGCGASVGMALAEAFLAQRFNTDAHALVDHFTYVLCSDGDLMEGISHEAASLAGHLKLGKLIWIYDDNRITIDGKTDLAYSDNVHDRFRAYGWHCQKVDDVNDLPLLSQAIENARQETTQPSLIIVRSHIGYGAPNKQDTSSAHGAPLGAAEIAAAKKAYGWPSDEPFFMPEDTLTRCRQAVTRGAEAEESWQHVYKNWQEKNPAAAAEWDRIQTHRLPADWESDIPEFEPDAKGIATRAASGQVMNALAPHIPEFLGGSADLAASVKTLLKNEANFSAEERSGRNVHFGVREHGMAAMANGLALHHLRPFVSTFLIFSDYMRPSIRLAALMQQHVVYVFSHDAINLGEDGPTHQPVEQLMALRAIPNLMLIRPADANETAVAWKMAMQHKDGPVVLVLTRQKAPTLAVTKANAAQGVKRGGYILSEADSGQPSLILIATGYEVHLALQAQTALEAKGVATRVVSLPCWEIFDAQSPAYQQEILPPNVPKISLEAGVTLGWRKYVGFDGVTIGLGRFGASAPGQIVYEKLGFTVENIVSQADKILQRVTTQLGVKSI